MTKQITDLLAYSPMYEWQLFYFLSPIPESLIAVHLRFLVMLGAVKQEWDGRDWVYYV